MGELRERLSEDLDDHRLDILSHHSQPLCVCADGDTTGPRWDTDHQADVVLDALRRQLEAFGRLCVEGGDMTPTAQRMLLGLLD